MKWIAENLVIFCLIALVFNSNLAASGECDTPDLLTKCDACVAKSETCVWCIDDDGVGEKCDTKELCVSPKTPKTECPPEAKCYALEPGKCAECNAVADQCQFCAKSASSSDITTGTCMVKGKTCPASGVVVDKTCGAVPANCPTHDDKCGECQNDSNCYYCKSNKDESKGKCKEGKVSTPECDPDYTVVQQGACKINCADASRQNNCVPCLTDGACAYCESTADKSKGMCIDNASGKAQCDKGYKQVTKADCKDPTPTPSPDDCKKCLAQGDHVFCMDDMTCKAKTETCKVKIDIAENCAAMPDDCSKCVESTTRYWCKKSKKCHLAGDTTCPAGEMVKEKKNCSDGGQQLSIIAAIVAVVYTIMK